MRASSDVSSSRARGVASARQRFARWKPGASKCCSADESGLMFSHPICAPGKFMRNSDISSLTTLCSTAGHYCICKKILWRRWFKQPIPEHCHAQDRNLEPRHRATAASLADDVNRSTVRAARRCRYRSRRPEITHRSLAPYLRLYAIMAPTPAYPVQAQQRSCGDTAQYR